MKLCGGFVDNEAWYGIKFSSKSEAENVMDFLEKSIQEIGKVNEEQTEMKGEQDE